MGIEDISKLNANAGICGFASALAALYVNQPSARSVIEGAVRSNNLDTRIIAEIKSFLVTLQSEAQYQSLLQEIEDFTKTFTGYENFSLTTYIQSINIQNLNNLDQNQSMFSIAMTPNAVITYLKIMGGRKGTRMLDLKDTRDDIILGIGVPDTNPKSCYGLKHWIYKKNDNVVYNYGKTESLATAIKRGGYTTLYKIRP